MFDRSSRAFTNKENVMQCPCCKIKGNKLKRWHGYVKCGCDHLFKVEMKGGARVAVAERDAPEDGGCKQGQDFPIPEGEMFDGK